MNEVTRGAWRLVALMQTVVFARGGTGSMPIDVFCFVLLAIGCIVGWGKSE